MSGITPSGSLSSSSCDISDFLPLGAPLNNGSKPLCGFSGWGGGARVLTVAEMAVETRKLLDLPLQDAFPVFSGASASALYCTMLLLPRDDGGLRRPEEVRDFFYDNVSTVFQRTLAHKVASADGLLRAKYENSGLLALIQQVAGDKTMGDLYGAVDFTVPVTREQDNVVRLYTNYRAEDKAVPLYDVLAGATAAPTYFPGFSYDGGIDIDGGLLANNPDTLTLDRLSELSGSYSTAGCLLLSVGTGQAPVAFPDADAGLEGWATTFTGVFMSAAEQFASASARRRLPPGHYLLAQTDIDAAHAALDAHSRADLDYYIQRVHRWVEDHYIPFEAFCRKVNHAHERQSAPPNASQVV